MLEIETAVREGAPVVILLLNDFSYGKIKQEQLHKFHEPRYIGVDFSDVDFAAAAKAMGADAERVTTGHELDSALSCAFKASQPYLIDAVIDPTISVWPMAF